MCALSGASEKGQDEIQRRTLQPTFGSQAPTGCVYFLALDPLVIQFADFGWIVHFAALGRRHSHEVVFVLVVVQYVVVRIIIHEFLRLVLVASGSGAF